jgi:hypothetical protein
VITRTTGSGRINAIKTQFTKIEFIYENIDDTYRVGIRNVIVKAFRQKCALGSAFALNEAFHLNAPQ